MNPEIFSTEKKPNELPMSQKGDCLLLCKKTKRDGANYESPSSRRCDICLEYQKFSDSKFIECIECGGQCHLNCFEDVISSNNLNIKNNKNDLTSFTYFDCPRCIFSKTNKINSNSLSCVICLSSKGILQRWRETNDFVHFKCKRFFPEILKEGDEKERWRTKFPCKVCKNKKESEKELYVIKCANTKCKNCFHVPCAIEKKIIIPLDFMMDYYAIKREENKTKAIPFYCSVHNRNLISAYENYIKDLDSLLINNSNLGLADENTPKEILFSKEIKFNGNSHILEATETDFSKQKSRKETNNLSHKSDDATKDDIDFTDFNVPNLELNLNIQNFNTLMTDFKLESPKNIVEDEVVSHSNRANEENNIYNMDDLKLIQEIQADLNLNNTFNAPQKPKYNPEDSLNINLNLPSFFPLPEYNFINIENNNNFNLNIEGGYKSFNDFFTPALATGKKDFNILTKQFYDYFDQDINKIKADGHSMVTLTQLQGLKIFFLRIMENYNKYDPDLKRMYDILRGENFI